MPRLPSAAMSLGFTVFAATQLGADSPSAVVPLTLDDRGAVIVQASIGGRGPFRLLVDTGSNRSAISETLARRVAARAVARSMAVSSSGSAWHIVAEVGDVAVGSTVRSRLLASVVPDGDLRAIGQVDGVLGQDFLGQDHYTIDYRRRRLTWDSDDAPVEIDARTIRLALRRDEGRFLVDLPQDEDGRRTVRFVPDSGAETLVIFDGGRPLPLTVHRNGRRANLLGLAGARTIEMASIEALRVGHAVFRDCPAVIAPGRDDVPGVDGLLPLSLFGRVSFRPDEGVLIVVPK